MSFLPVNIFFFALTPGPLGLGVVPEHLALAAGALGLYLKALAQGREVVLEGCLALAVGGLAGVVVGEHAAQLAGALGEVLVAELQRLVEVLLEEERVTAAVRLRGLRVHDEEVALVAGTLGVQLMYMRSSLEKPHLA